MIYKKPKAHLDPRADDRAILNFLDSLPDSFEIVPDGHVCVKWPRMLTRQCLLDQAVMVGRAGFNGTASDLYELAVIAPVEKKKKRRVHLWEKDYPHYTERSWTSDDISRPGEGWRKVGECEVTE